MQVTVYIADGSVDLISDSDKDRKIHAKYLKDQGCAVKVKTFDNWTAAQTFADKIEGN